MGKKKSAKSANGNGSAANLGFEAKLWLAADTLRDTLLPKLLSGELSVVKSGKLT